MKYDKAKDDFIGNDLAAQVKTLPLCKKKSCATLYLSMHRDTH